MNTINKQHRNEYALVTGASSGFGYELAKRLASDGFNLVIVARAEEQLLKVTDELKQSYDVEVTPIAKDLFSPSSPKEIYDEIQQKGIVINILINDAGQGEWGNFIEIPLERSLNIIQLNIASLVALTHLFGKDMAQRGEGKILQLASEAGKAPMPLLSVYAATKAFVISFSIALANELKETGVTVTVLMPGAADTDFFHKANAEETKTYLEETLQSPEEVAADGYEALMSGESKIVSGGKTKMHVYMANLMPDEVVAGKMRKKMEPSKKETAKRKPGHKASKEERKNIEDTTGKASGDL